MALGAAGRGYRWRRAACAARSRLTPEHPRIPAKLLLQRSDGLSRSRSRRAPPRPPTRRAPVARGQRAELRALPAHWRYGNLLHDPRARSPLRRDGRRRVSPHRHHSRPPTRCPGTAGARHAAAGRPRADGRRGQKGARGGHQGLPCGRAHGGGAQHGAHRRRGTVPPGQGQRRAPEEGGRPARARAPLPHRRRGRRSPRQGLRQVHRHRLQGGRRRAAGPQPARPRGHPHRARGRGASGGHAAAPERGAGEPRGADGRQVCPQVGRRHGPRHLAADG
mmetsp:Transcript_11774/g.40261  ORF Transcript_11774/g.40261 Transcript_11774/m.40261 type:complete len:278 (+) Transcript_11774:477-1310(+)